MIKPEIPYWFRDAARRKGFEVRVEYYCKEPLYRKRICRVDGLLLGKETLVSGANRRDFADCHSCDRSHWFHLIFREKREIPMLGKETRLTFKGNQRKWSFYLSQLAHDNFDQNGRKVMNAAYHADNERVAGDERDGDRQLDDAIYQGFYPRNGKVTVDQHGHDAATV